MDKEAHDKTTETIAEVKEEPTEETKAGRRNRSDDQKALDEIHDLVVKSGATCDKAADDSDGDEKAKVLADEALAYAKAKHASSRPRLQLLTEIAELEAMVYRVSRPR